MDMDSDPSLPTVTGYVYLHDNVPLTRATRIFALCAALNSVNLGYDLGVSTNAGPKLQDEFDLSDVQLE